MKNQKTLGNISKLYSDKFAILTVLEEVKKGNNLKLQSVRCSIGTSKLLKAYSFKYSVGKYI